MPREHDDLPGIDFSGLQLPAVPEDVLGYGQTVLMALCMGLAARASIDVFLVLYSQTTWSSRSHSSSESSSQHSPEQTSQDVIPVWLLYLGIVAGVAAIIYIITATTSKSIRRFPLDISIRVQDDFPEAHPILTSLSKPARRVRSRRTEEVPTSAEAHQQVGTSLHHRMVIVPPPITITKSPLPREPSPDSDATLTEQNTGSQPWHIIDKQPAKTPDSGIDRRRQIEKQPQPPRPSRTELEAEIQRLQLMLSATHARQARRRR